MTRSTGPSGPAMANGSGSWLWSLSCSRPYFPLHGDNDKEYKSLKARSDYIGDVFCQKQTLIAAKELHGLGRGVKDMENRLDGAMARRLGGTACVVVAVAATGGLAFYLAPAVATGVRRRLRLRGRRIVRGGAHQREPRVPWWWFPHSRWRGNGRRDDAHRRRRGRVGRGRWRGNVRGGVDGDGHEWRLRVGGMRETDRVLQGRARQTVWRPRVRVWDQRRAQQADNRTRGKNRSGQTRHTRRAGRTGTATGRPVPKRCSRYSIAVLNT